MNGSRAVLYAALVFCTVLMLTPLVWLFAATLKGPDDLFHYLFFAPRLSSYNFEQLFTQIPYIRFMVNSFFVTGSTVLVQLFFSSLGGFALAKYEFKGKKLIMVLMLAMMMIPAQVMLAPMYELIYSIGLVDSHLGLIIPGAVSIFGIFLFRQSMLDLPDDLLQA